MTYIRTQLFRIKRGLERIDYYNSKNARNNINSKCITFQDKNKRWSLLAGELPRKKLRGMKKLLYV